jgi:hypothetical protein
MDSIPMPIPSSVSSRPNLKRKDGLIRKMQSPPNQTFGVYYSAPDFDQFVSDNAKDDQSSFSSSSSTTNATSKTGSTSIDGQLDDASFSPSPVPSSLTEIYSDHNDNITNDMNINKNINSDLLPETISPTEETVTGVGMVLRNNNNSKIQTNYANDKNEIDDTLANQRTRRLVKPKKNTVQKNRRSYDMNLVPFVKRNVAFLNDWREKSLKLLQNAQQHNENDCWNDSNYTPTNHNNKSLSQQEEKSSSVPNLVLCDSSTGTDNDDDKSKINFLNPTSEASSLIQNTQSKNTETTPSTLNNDKNNNNLNLSQNTPLSQSNPNGVIQNQIANEPSFSSIATPFAPDCDSVIWIPSTRSEWEDCIDEMTAVCTAAAWHRHLKAKLPKDLFYPPLSRIYIRDRIDIDDPLVGFQIRHKKGGWLQGFVMMTTFTTWTHYFKWDSLHPASGISDYAGIVPSAEQNNDQKGVAISRTDDGCLANELENQFRSGDPLTKGVVWPTIAEIGLVGALGCGEYLLQMALDYISQNGKYEYVVLQATDSSRPFYEKFGFVRVGAVSKYGDAQDFISDSNVNVEEVGYRHWTYANETSQRLDEHGAPSIMMARRIIRQKLETSCASDGSNSDNQKTTSFMNELSPYIVSEKPAIQSLTKGRKKRSLSNIVTPTGDRSKKVARISAVSNSANNSASKKVKKGKGLSIHKPPNSRTKSPSIPPSRSSRATRVPPQKITNNNVPQVETTEFPEMGPLSKRSSLRKQKIANMYRDPKKVYYYNKVVSPRKSTTGTGSSNNKNEYKSIYYFVLHYDEDLKTIRIIPLYKRGTFKGMREGRQKWKANVLERNAHDGEEAYLRSMDVITEPCSMWDIVPSYMVTKCSSVAEESWDILL